MSYLEGGFLLLSVAILLVPIFAAGPRCFRGNRINKIISFMISLIIKIFKRLLKMS
jgi:hypothetical protein